MQAGLYDDIPHGRELVWIMLANRAARGLASLRVQANEIGLDEAGKFHAGWTPRGWSDATASSSASSSCSTCASPATGRANRRQDAARSSCSRSRRTGPSSNSGRSTTAPTFAAILGVGHRAAGDHRGRDGAKRPRRAKSTVMARVLLIVGGGIAAYKSLELVRLLKKAGHSGDARC